MLSEPTTGDLSEAMAVFNSLNEIGIERQ